MGVEVRLAESLPGPVGERGDGIRRQAEQRRDLGRAAALDLGVPTYRFLRRYLERRPPLPLTLRQVDPLIRQLTLYRDLIDRTTGDPS